MESNRILRLEMDLYHRSTYSTPSTTRLLVNCIANSLRRNRRNFLSMIVMFIMSFSAISSFAMLPIAQSTPPNPPTPAPSTIKPQLPPGDPVTIYNAGSDHSETTNTYQRKVWFANGRYWAFFFTAVGTFSYSQSSDGGVTWSAASTIGSANTGWSAHASTYVYQSGSTWYVWYSWAYRLITSYTDGAGNAFTPGQTDLITERGVLNSGGTITWSKANDIPLTPTIGSTIGGSTIAVDGNGFPYVWLISGNAGGVSPFRTYLFVDANNDGTWSTAYSSSLSAANENDWGGTVTQFSATQVYVSTFSTLGTTEIGFLCNESSCGSSETIDSVAMDCFGLSLVVTNSLVYSTYETSTGVVDIRIRSSGVWSGATQVKAGLSTDACPSLVTFKNSVVYIVWVSGTTINDAYYSSGNVGTSASFVTGETNIDPAGSMTTFQGPDGSNVVGVMWTQNPAFPANCTGATKCNVRFATFTELNPVFVANLISPTLELDMSRVAVDSNAAPPYANSGRQVLLDASPYANFLTTTAPSTTVAGAIGTAQKFDGSTNFWTVADTPSLEFNFQSSLMTAAMWVQPLAFPAKQSCMMEKWQEYALCMWADGTFSWQLWNGVGWTIDNSTYKANVNQWTNIVGVWNATHLQIFIDSIPQTVVAVNSVGATTANALYLGENKTGSVFFNGVIDEVYIYRRVLSVTEITNEMATGITDTPTTRIAFTTGTGAFIGNNPELPTTAPDKTGAGQASQSIYNLASVAYHSYIKLNASETGVDTADNITYLFSLYHLGLREFTYALTISYSGFGGAHGGGNNTLTCLTSPYCSIQLTWFTIDNTGKKTTIQQYSVSNSTDRTPCCGTGSWLGEPISQGCCWLTIDQWVSQDTSQLFIRVSNGDNSQQCAWTGAGCKFGETHFGTISPSSFLEYAFNIQDTAGNLHPLNYFDIVQKAEVFMYGGHTGSGLRQFSVLFHRQGWENILPCVAVGIGAGALLAETLVGGVVVGFAAYTACIGVIGPGAPANSPNCGSAQALCNFGTNIVNTFNSGVSNAVGGNGQSGILSTTGIGDAIANAFGKAWHVFETWVDSAAAFILNQPNTTYFTSFVNQLGSMVTTLANNIGPIVSGMFAGFSSVITITTNIVAFFTGSNAGNMFTLLATWTGKALNSPGGIATFTNGTLGFFTALFGQGNGPNGTQFSYAGITYDWGPAGQILGNTGFQTFIFLMIGLWLLKRFLNDPMGTSHEVFGIGHDFFTVIKYGFSMFFEIFDRIFGRLKSVIPTMGD